MPSDLCSVAHGLLHGVTAYRKLRLLTDEHVLSRKAETTFNANMDARRTARSQHAVC